MQENNSSIFEFGFDDTGKSHLKNISQWAGVYAIVSFISLGVTILTLIMIGSRYSAAAAGTATGSQLISIVITLLMNIILYNASSQIRKALNNLDQSMLTKGLGSLKTYFKVCGILLIILFVIVFFVFIFVAMAGGGGRGF